MRNRNDFERLRFERHVLAVLVHWYVPALATLSITTHNSQLNITLCENIAGGPLEDSGQRAKVLKLLASCRQRAGWPVDDLGEKLKSQWWEGST